MPNCERCKAEVSHDYVRVFGDNDDTVSACPACRQPEDDRPDTPTYERAITTTTTPDEDITMTNTHPNPDALPAALRCTECGWPTRDGMLRMQDHLSDEHGIERDVWAHIEESDGPTTRHRVLF